ncbi:MAG: hypothetical protein WAN81_20545 [Candidatus Binataceae bacterium]
MMAKARALPEKNSGVGSAFFGNYLDGFRKDSLAVRIRDDKKLEAVALRRVAYLNFTTGSREHL